MLRVLHVISQIYLIRGGPSTALMGLSEALVRGGVSVSLVTQYDQMGIPPEKDQLERAGVRVELVGPTIGKHGLHRMLEPTLRQATASADVVHIHALWEAIQHEAAVAARRQGKPYIFRPCGMLDPWSLRQRWLKKKVYMALRLKRDLNHASAMHYTSELERDLAATLGLRSPSLVVPNGVDLREFADLPERGFLRQRFSQIGDRRIVLFLSRIHPKKGLDLLVEGFARAGTAGRVLVITGPDCDGYEAEIRRLVRARNLDDSVVFTGPLYGRDRIAALRDADLFALPSHQENFGIAVVEALAAGVPVLISDQVNIYREIQKENVGGVVRMDVDELAGALDRWLSDNALRAAAAARARPLARDRYDWSKIAGRWITEYERLAGRLRQEHPLGTPAVNIK